jgi:hypothetical protein
VRELSDLRSWLKFQLSRLTKHVCVAVFFSAALPLCIIYACVALSLAGYLLLLTPPSFGIEERLKFDHVLRSMQEYPL